MKIFVAFVLAFSAAIASFAINSGRAKGCERIVVQQEAKGLAVFLAADRRRYAQGDRVKLQVSLINSDDNNDLFVFGTLDWGYSASLTLHLRDQKGKNIQPAFLDDALTLPLRPNDTSQFVKLAPNHFLGTYYESSLRELRITRPGRYSIVVEYHSPFSTTEAGLRPFWGRENGVIRSNVAYVEVHR